MNFGEAKTLLTKDLKRIRRSSWSTFISIGLHTVGFVFIYHDGLPMNPWHPTRLDLDGTDWEVDQ